MASEDPSILQTLKSETATSTLQEKLYRRLIWNNNSTGVSVDKKIIPRRLRPLSHLKTSVTCVAARDGLNKSNCTDAQSCSSALYRPESSCSLESLKNENSSLLTSESGYGSRPSSSASAYSEMDLSVFSKELRTCLEELSPFTKECSDSSEKELIATVAALHHILKSNRLIGVRKWRGRTPVLKALFAALNPGQPNAAMKIATVCLALGVSGKNLNSLLIFLRGLCQVVRISDCSTNEDHLCSPPDSEFIHELLRVCENLSADSDAEMVLCVLETLNCIASKSDESTHHLLDGGIIGIVCQWWIQLVGRSQQDALSSEILQNSAGLLRNQLDIGRKARIQLLELQFCPLLVQLLWIHKEQKENVLQISRILSAVSLHEDFCENLLAAEPDLLYSVSVLIGQYFCEEAIILRLLFVTGNLLSVSEKAQWHLHQQQQFYPSLLKAFGHYLTAVLTKGNAESCTEEESKDANHPDQQLTSVPEDILIKMFQLVRLLANILVHSGVGPILCLNEELLSYLLLVLENCSLSENEELILNTLTTLHNLSFYTADGSAVAEHQLKIAEGVYPCLMDSNLRGAIEACNVVGNLSRYSEVQKWLLERKVHVMMMSLLDSSSSELVSSACGILINLTLTLDGCATIQQHQHELEKNAGVGSCSRLPLGWHCILWVLNVLRSNTGKNWTVCSLGCKLFWNLVASGVTFETKRELVEWLLQNTDESVALCQKNLPEDLRRQIRNLWEDEFCKIATDLLAYFSDFKADSKIIVT